MRSDRMVEAYKIIENSRDGTLQRPVISTTLNEGEAAFLRKLGETASQVVMACKEHKYGDGTPEQVRDEISSVLYYLMIALAYHQVEMDDVFRIMWEKRGWSAKPRSFVVAIERIYGCRDGQLKDSHIRKTLRKGDDKILRKIGEEASEAVMACKDYGLKQKPRDYVAEEIGDVLYYVMIAMAHHELDPDAVFATIQDRYGLTDTPPAQRTTAGSSTAADYPDRPLALNSAFYVTRATIDDNCHQEVAKPGSLVRIRGPKGFGKTSLLNRILSQASDNGLSTVRLNLDIVPRETLHDLDKFLRWVCAMTTRQLQLESKVDAHWDADLIGSMESCTAYFQDYLLEELEEPLVLGLDAVDRLFDAPEVAQDFFALIRVWHEEANNLDIWQRLRLVVAHATEVYIPLELNRSPFNVGIPVRLPEFTATEVSTLAHAHGLPWQAEDTTRLMAMVGGHPYLVQLTLYHLVNGQHDLEQLLGAAASPAGIYNSYLRGQLQRLQEHSELAEAFKAVITQAKHGLALSPILRYKLESLGLASIDGDAVKPGCELYQHYFKDKL